MEAAARAKLPENEVSAALYQCNALGIGCQAIRDCISGACSLLSVVSNLSGDFIDTKE
jgi:hypothetical protein